MTRGIVGIFISIYRKNFFYFREEQRIYFFKDIQFLRSHIYQLRKSLSAFECKIDYPKRKPVVKKQFI